ncbi:hypothetical protein KCV87_32985 [Actinosynnema pretiosum subsp. pretiosum]|uniref:Uncharacterized protein n=1 Tax=Actinosynnema pretiosum subsp. pretiosum TaxID=103721 RepID=A0AA45L698_9PSEU|nr:hypothetical protein KCV87_32985 [Actinosynnema pretiosum subsp. pretiosum]
MTGALTEAGITSVVGSACVLGAGATAASALAALNTLGCTTVIVLARDTTRTTALHEAAERLGVAGRGKGAGSLLLIPGSSGIGLRMFVSPLLLGIGRVWSVRVERVAERRVATRAAR